MIADKSVLGSMLIDNYLIAESNLNADQFINPTNRMIFQSMTELRSAGKSLGVLSETKNQVFDCSRQMVPKMRRKIRKMISEHPGVKPLSKLYNSFCGIKLIIINLSPVL